MARGRMVSTMIWKSRKVTSFSLRHRLLWIGIITTADDQGRGDAHPGLIRGVVFPLEDVSFDEIEEGLKIFEQEGLIMLYEAEGKTLYQIVNWWQNGHQGAMRWAWPSEYAAPEGWADRLCYRQGNRVIKENWEEASGEAKEEEDVPPDDDTPTVAPPRDDGEPNVTPAPKGNGKQSKVKGKEIPRDAEKSSSTAVLSAEDAEWIGANRPPQQPQGSKPPETRSYFARPDNPGAISIPVQAGGKDVPAETLVDYACKHNKLSGIDVLPAAQRVKWVREAASTIEQWGANATVAQIRLAFQVWQADTYMHTVDVYNKSFQRDFGMKLVGVMSGTVTPETLRELTKDDRRDTRPTEPDYRAQMEADPQYQTFKKLREERERAARERAEQQA